MNISIPVVLGKGRLECQSEKVAHCVHSQLSGFEDVKSVLVDVRDYLVSPLTIPAWVEDKNAAVWRKIARNAAGFIFVVSEYNRSFQGALKLFFNSAFKEYNGKLAILASVSSGQYCGVRGIQQLTPVLLAASIETFGDTATTSHVESLFNEEETPTDEKYPRFVNDALTALITKLK